MPSRLFLRGDSDGLWLLPAADEALTAVERALSEGTAFVRLDMLPEARHEPSRPAYFAPSAVSAILPLDPRAYEHYLDNDVPEWLS